MVGIPRHKKLLLFFIILACGLLGGMCFRRGSTDEKKTASRVVIKNEDLSSKNLTKKNNPQSNAPSSKAVRGGSVEQSQEKVPSASAASQAKQEDGKNVPAVIPRLTGAIENANPETLNTASTPLESLGAEPLGLGRESSTPYLASQDSSEKPGDDELSSVKTSGLQQPPTVTKASPTPPSGGIKPFHRIVTHRIRDGDSLEFLALRYLGDAGRAEELFQINRSLLPNREELPIGKELVIPLGEDPAAQSNILVDSSQAKAPAGKPLETSLSTQVIQAGPLVSIQARPRKAPIPTVQISSGGRSQRTYRVKADDTLVEIAREFYDDGSRYRDLLEANRDRLKGPQDLQEGMLLVIPE